MPAISTPVPIPSPYGGINSRDGVSALSPQDARELENLDPSGNSVRPRKGYVLSSTSDESEQHVGTLAAYNGDTDNILIGVAGGKVIDFTSATAVELHDGMFTDDHFRTVCYNNYLIAVNGTDTPWSFNGTSVSATGFSGSGLTLTNLTNVNKVRDRLWFCENNTADVWYGSVQAITGTLTKFQLSQVTRGGVCMAIGAHSQDAGAGPDDYTVFVMSTGEIVVYSGDPSTTFSKVGNYQMPSPVGRRCLVNIGGPLAVLTHMGLVPIQAAVSGLALDSLSIGNYGKASPSIKADIDANSDDHSWHMVFHEGKVIINAPLTETTSRQWVYNPITSGGAWTSWTGINTHTLCVMSTTEENTLYFGGVTDGKVYKQYGTTDNGQSIRVKSKGAYVIPSNGHKAKATAILFAMQIEGSLIGGYGLDLDFIGYPITLSGLTLAQSTSSTPWGSDWGSEWSTINQTAGQWFSTYGEGHSLALTLDAYANVTDMSWEGAHVLIRSTGI